jgi:HAD superfamily hydrolase (TIGR01509 family)
MDGTVFDTERLLCDAWYETSKAWSLDEYEEVYNKVIGLNVKKALDILRESYGQDFPAERFFAERMALFFSNIEKEIPLKKGARELLTYLKQNGIKTAIATSSDKAVAERNLEKTGLTDYFDAVIGGDMVSRGKPDPEIFLKAADKISANPEETIVCEDAYTGIAAASSAKMKPVMVIDMLPPTSETESVCFATCNDLLEVLELIKKENNN